MDMTLQNLLRDPEAAKFPTDLCNFKDAERVFEEIWATMRKEKLIAGQPRSISSIRAMDFGRVALNNELRDLYLQLFAPLRPFIRTGKLLIVPARDIASVALPPLPG
jgi:hypothetical protein